MLPELDNVIVYLGDEEIELDLGAMVPIADDLSAEFSQQPSLYAYIAVLAARCEAAWYDAKRNTEEVRAETDKIVRDEFDSIGAKTTEAKINAEILTRKGYKEALDLEAECYQDYLIMRALTRTFDMRAQMLISLGAQLRAEAGQTGMLIRDTKQRLREISSARVSKTVDTDIPF